MSPKNRTFMVSFTTAALVDIEVSAASLEEAVTKARDMKCSEVLGETNGEVIDWNLQVTGAYDHRAKPVL